MTFVPEDGSAPIQETVYDFQAGGVAMGMYNTDKSTGLAFCENSNIFKNITNPNGTYRAEK